MISRVSMRRPEGWALSMRNIRRGSLALFLLYPLVACTFDLMNAVRDFQWLGMDSVTLQILAFSLPLLGAFFLRRPQMLLTRLCAWIALACIVLMYFAPPSFEIIFCLLFDAAIGFCYLVSMYVMMFRLNNAERLIGLLLLYSLYYALSTMLRPILQSAFSYSLDYTVVYANAALFALALVFVLHHIGQAELAEPGLGGVDGSGPTEKPSAGCYAVFVLSALYDFYAFTLAGLTFNTLMTNLSAIAIGTLAGIALILAAHRWLQNGSWHVWNLFLAATTVGVLCAFGRSYAAHSVAIGLLSAGETFGITATMYMVLGIGKRARHIAFLRWYCGQSLVMVALPILVFQLDLDALSQNYLLLSLAAMTLCLLITVLIAPVLQRYLFNMEWADAFRQIDIDVARETVAQASEAELAGLTPREREVCALLLCGKSMRQIGGELSISQSTVSFHCRDLYQKMGVGSRTELFAKFSDRFTITS